MNFRTKQFLKKRFGEYYQTSGLILPPDFTRREWGFIFFDEMPNVVMRRHKAFSSEGEAFEYLRGMVPAHVYHSAAYYVLPGARTMKDKLWKGADLIFDLDADHLPMKAKSYGEMLDNVKNETSKLIKDFLLNDFGFSENNISIVFSGGRGYHIHVRDPKVLSLESTQRREILDYLSGTGLMVDYLIKSEKYIVQDIGKFKKKELQSPKRISSFDSASEGFGWGNRISRYIIHFLKDISTRNENDAINELIDLIKNYNLKKVHSETLPDEIVKLIIQMKNENRRIGYKKIANEVGVSEKKVREVLIVHDLKDYALEAKIKLKKIKKKAINPKALDMIESKGIIDDPYIFDAIVQKAIEENSINLGSAHTDEPVTADVKRLIRMPSSLHGGSGMRVVPLSLSQFEKFQPLNDAVVFSEKETNIEVISPLKPQNSIVEMRGKTITVKEGINTLPEYAAIYLMCRGAAEYA